MIHRLARYHHWAYQQLYVVVDQLTEDDYLKNMKLFFKSVHGTLNHLLLVEQLWMSRFKNRTFQITKLNEIIVKDRGELKIAIDKQAHAWIAFIDSLSAKPLPNTLKYADMEGVVQERHFETLLYHVFNHATHHRGQISAALTQLGKDAPMMDLVYTPRRWVFGF